MAQSVEVSHFHRPHTTAHRQDLSMQAQRSVRRYHCARCHCPVLICSDCDRGHVYCFDGCREAAYQERCRRNARRYRSSAKGCRNNSQRQQRFRKRARDSSVPVCRSLSTPAPGVDTPDAAAASTEKSKKVTHRGSAAAGAGVVLPVTRNTGTPIRCNRCQRSCSVYVRLGFLRTRCRHQSTVP